MLFPKNTADAGMQRWDLGLNNVPDQFEVDTEIAMNQAIPRSGHPAPVQVGVAGLKVIGKIF